MAGLPLCRRSAPACLRRGRMHNARGCASVGKGRGGESGGDLRRLRMPRLRLQRLRLPHLPLSRLLLQRLRLGRLRLGLPCHHLFARCLVGLDSLFRLAGRVSPTRPCPFTSSLLARRVSRTRTRLASNDIRTAVAVGRHC